MKPEELLILVADDDEDDRFLISEAFNEVTNISKRVVFVSNGLELLEFLHHEWQYELPILILLDLNMPQMDGNETLRALREHVKYKVTPTVVLSTSSAEPDIQNAYSLGANSFFSKPQHFEELVSILKSLCDYWGTRVLLPGYNSRFILRA